MSRLSSTTLRIGDPVPPFSLPTLDGDRYQLGDLLETGVGLLVFVPGSWSPGTRQLVSELNGLHETLLDAGITLAMIFTQDASSLRRRLETRPPFPVLIDQDRSVVRDFGVYRAVSWHGIGITRPAAFIVDHEGVIRFMYVGERDGDIPDVPALLRLGSWLRGDIPLPERPVRDEADEELRFPLEATQVVPVVVAASEPSPQPAAAFSEDVADAGGETEARGEPETENAADAEGASEVPNGSSAPDVGDASEVTETEAAPELPQSPSPTQNGSPAHQEPGAIRRPTAMGTSTDR